MTEAFEDNWHDIACKAMRGLQLDIETLAQRNQIEKSVVDLLIKKAILDEKTLVAIAPTLNLNSQALLTIALDPECHSIPELPNNFRSFTTSYHGMEVHSYLLWSNENRKAIAFDTGADLTPLLQQLNEHQLQLSAISLTHGHGDHVGQLKKLIDQTGAPAWINEYDLVPGAQPLSSNYRYQLDSTISIEARSTPGHSPGGTTYVIHGTSPMIAIVGDALFARSVGGIPQESYKAALKAIEEKILSLPENSILAPGHGPLTTVGDEKKSNPFFIE